MDVDLVRALEMLSAVTVEQAQPIMKMAIDELRRLRELEAAVMACLDADNEEEKRAGWGEVRKLWGR